MAGYVKTFRKMTEWQWYKNTNTKSLFIHCLLQANYKEKKWQGIEIKRGQFITSIDKLHLETGLTVREVRTALNNLILTNELTKETTSKYTMITVIKYSDYQSDDDIDDKENDKVIDKQTTNKRQTNDKQTTTTNKDKKDNKENKVNNKDIVKQEYAQVVEYLNQKTGKNFRVSTQTKKLIDARLHENFLIDDFYKVIDNQCDKWLSDEKMIDYLRPQTLFSNKFESYLNTIKKKKFNIMDL